MRIYASSISDFDSQNVTITTRQMGKSVTNTDNKITYIRCGKGEQSLEGLTCALYIIRAIFLSIITLGICPLVSEHIRANIRGKVIVSLYLQDPAKSTAGKVDTAVKPIINNDPDSARFGKWPSLHIEAIQRLDADETLKLINRDLTYISGLTEAQKKNVVPKILLCASNSKAHLHFLRNIDISLLTTTQKIDLSCYVDFSTCSTSDLRKFIPLLSHTYMNSWANNAQIRELINQVDIRELQDVELDVLFGKPNSPLKEHIATLSSTQCSQLIARNIAYVFCLPSYDKQRLIPDLDISKLLSCSNITDSDKWHFSQSKLTLFVASKTLQELQALSGTELANLFTITQQRGMCPLQKLSTNQIVQLLHRLQQSDFASLPIAIRTELFTRKETYSSPAYYNTLNEAEKERYIQSVDIKRLTDTEMRLLFPSNDARRFAFLTGQQMLDFVERDAQYVQKFSFRAYERIILAKLPLANLTEKQFSAFFNPRTSESIYIFISRFGNSLIEHITSEQVIDLWPKLKSSHFASLPLDSLKQAIARKNLDEQDVLAIFTNTTRDANIHLLSVDMIRKHFDHLKPIFHLLSVYQALDLSNNKAQFTAAEQVFLCRNSIFAARNNPSPQQPPRRGYYQGHNYSNSYGPSYDYNTYRAPEDIFNQFFGFNTFRQAPPPPPPKAQEEIYSFTLTVTALPPAGALLDFYNAVKKAERTKLWHEAFGLKADYTHDQLKTVRKKLMLKLHPDKYRESVQVQNIAKEIMQAFNDISAHLAKKFD